MQTATATSVGTLRIELRRAAHGRIMPRLWHRLQHEWHCAADRAVARTVQAIARPCVQDDYRMAVSQRCR